MPKQLRDVKARRSFYFKVTLTGEGNLSVEMTFDSMEDFSPGAVAQKVESLNQLLTARNQLWNLLTYMDGKVGAEELIRKILGDPALLNALASAPKSEATKPADTAS